MTNEEITVLEVLDGWRVDFERAPHSVLLFQSAGLDIYVRGRLISEKFEVLANIAINECLSRRIPTASLRTINKSEKPSEKTQTADSEGRTQKNLL